MKHATRFDVIILGSGLGGTMLAAVLARQGRSVLVLERRQHPRFAIGESTTPSATVSFKMLGGRFDVPEIAALGDFYSAAATVGPSNGMKQAFSFVFHEAGKEQDPRQTNQLPTLAALGHDVHLYRQDVDAFMMMAAIRHGATVLQNVGACEVDLEGEGVRVATERGDTFEGHFLVDGTGHGSVVARTLDLREEPCSFDTDSRSIFTHMVGVRPYDAVSDRKRLGFRYASHQTTLHHLFDGGWFWVIPFDNHPGSTNPLCSVGLTLDRRKYPRRPDLDPETEFTEFVSRFPAVAAQFEEATAVRGWVGTDRIQYGSRRLHGRNWCLLPHSAGFIDPLFSAGLPQTAAAVYHLGLTLGGGDRVGEAYDTMLRSSFATADALVSTSYDALRRGYDVWNAWYRVWVVGSVLGPYMQIVGLSHYYETGEKSHLDACQQPTLASLLGFGVPAMAELLDDCTRLVRDTSISDRDAADRILERVRKVSFVVKHVGYRDAQKRGLTPFTLGLIFQLYWRMPKLLRPVLPVELPRVSLYGLVKHQVRAWLPPAFKALPHALAPVRGLLAAD